MFGTLRQFQHALAATLAGQFQLDVDYARARGYDTALEAYMDKDDMATAVYKNLVSTINANLPLLHRYVELRKKALGLDDLHLYDLYIPLAEGVAWRCPLQTPGTDISPPSNPLGGLRQGPRRRARPGERLDGPLPPQRQAQRRLLGRAPTARTPTSS